MRKAVVPLAIGCLFLTLTGCSGHGKSNASAPVPTTNRSQPEASPPTTANLPAETGPAQPVNQFLANLYIKMIDEQSGWAWNNQSAFRTSDGGAAWTEVTPVIDRISQENCPSLYGHFFLDSNTGWIAGYDKGKPTIFRTVDSGKTWDGSGVDLKPYIDQATLDFIDAKTGWMMVSYGAACGSEPVDIYSTVDGGVSWTLVSSAIPQSPAPLLYGGDKTGLGFVDSKRGWVTGTCFYRTDDGGKTWSGQKLIIPNGLSTEGNSAATEPPVFDGAAGLLPFVFYGRPDGPSVIIYRTSDRGQTWNATKPLKLSASYSQFLWSASDLEHLFVSGPEI